MMMPFIVSVALLVAALLIIKFVPKALQRHDGGSRVRRWTEGAIPPIMYLVIVACICSAVTALFSLLPESVEWISNVKAKLPDVTERIVRIAAVVFIGWAFIGANRRSNFFLPQNKREKDVSRQALLRFVSGLFNLVVIAFIVVIVITEFGYNVTGLVTGLGLGGLTFALAAKDAAANFFGGAIIVTERPFEIGDTIQTSKVEGTVIDINMRATTIRDNSGARTIVPNALLSGDAITNWSGGMKRRRLELNLNFEYGSKAEAVTAFIEEARALLAVDDEIDPKDQAVRFFDLGTSSLVVKLYCYTKKPSYSEYLRIRERLLYTLMDLAKKHRLKFAFAIQMSADS